MQRYAFVYTMIFMLRTYICIIGALPCAVQA